MSKEALYQEIDGMREEMAAMADDIFDHPEIGMEEFHAAEVLTGWLKKEGFEVERGVAEVPTAFRAVYRHGEAAPISACSANTTRSRGSAMPAAIICRGPASWPRPRR